MIDISYDQMKSHLNILCDKIKHIEFDHLIGIERGGLPIAEYIGKQFNKPVNKIKISFYKGTEITKVPKIELYNLKLSITSKKLIVDDIVDSGSTINIARELFSNIKFASVVATNPNYPDFWVIEKKKGDWINFPWELSNDQFDDKFMEKLMI